MATILGVDLGLGGILRAGAAFRCTLADRESVVIEIAEGQLVHLRPRDGVIVAQLERPLETGYLAAHEAAQRTLDITAYLGGPSLSLVAPHDEFVQWWSPPDDDGFVVRAVVTREVGITFGASLNVLGPDGRSREPVPEPPANWTAALRFFRYAQLAEDVFDAYRNVYLGLEAVLSELVADAPQGERAWLEYALRTIVVDRGIDLVPYLAGASEDPVALFVEEQYEALRCATFHAKRHRASLLPGSADERETVAAALGHLAQLVVDLAERVVGRRRMSGGMTPIGFEGSVIAPKVGNLEMHLLRREGGAVVESIEMSSGYLGPVPDVRGEHLFGGELPAEPLAGREFDGVRVVAAGGVGLASGPFDETFDFLPVEVSGADAVQIFLAFVLRNLQMPRTRFPR